MSAAMLGGVTTNAVGRSTAAFKAYAKSGALRIAWANATGLLRNKATATRHALAVAVDGLPTI